MSPCRRTMLVVSIYGILSPLTLSADEAAQARRLFGTWRGTKGVWSGKTLTAEQAGTCVLRIHPPRRPDDLSGGNRGLDLVVPNKVVGFDLWISDTKKETHYATEWLGYSYSLDPSANPSVLQTFKLIGIKGHGFGGIYRFDGDTLTICLSFRRFEPLPRTFAAPARSELLLLTLKREK